MRHALLLTILAVSSIARADGRADLRFDAREALALASQPEEAAELPDAAPPPRLFGEQSDKWWVTAGVAAGGVIGRNDVFGEGFLTFSAFVADRFEVGAEFGGWYLDQDGTDNTGGGSASVVFRWHFLVEKENHDWTVFASAGAGALLTADDVAQDGTEFNFLPTAGLGFTHRLGDGQSRLIAGLKWQHISNARLAGGDNNPGRDFGTLYVGVMWPF